VSVSKQVRQWAYRAIKKGKFRSKGAWIRQRNVADPNPLPEFGLFAIIPTFCEADIIAATVANAFAQGCTGVYIVDNDSPDETVANAVAAGATVAEVWTSDAQDGVEQKTKLYSNASRISAEGGYEHAWWLHIDADEFPKGPHGLTVREYLSGLDRSHRIVGSDFFTHLPTERPHYVPGFHPGEFQPLCYPQPAPYCRQKHFKHLLLRYDQEGRPLRLGGGQHRIDPACGKGVLAVEPKGGLIVQHFQWRREDDTRRRLEYIGRRLNDNHQPGLSMFRRLETVDAVYHQDWARVHDDSTKQLGVHLQPFADLVAPADASIRRWYSEDELAAAMPA
jgi:Glycosyl transferase family 2